MAENTSYKPGMFCWTDLQTSDLKAAERFYGEIFGWKTESMPMPGGGVYDMAEVRGKRVAGLSGMTPDMEAQHIPPHWNVYFSVADVDASTKKAETLGGKVMAPPFDVMDAGRMSVIADPSGAAFCLWQTKRSEANLMAEPGAPSWPELSTRNVDACGSFYSKLFDWKAETSKMGDMLYTSFNVGKEPNAGMMAMPKDVPAHVPSYWSVYFEVTNCDSSSTKAKSLGAKQLVQPTDIPDIGRFAIFTDPQGATFAILQAARRN